MDYSDYAFSSASSKLSCAQMLFILLSQLFLSCFPIYMLPSLQASLPDVTTSFATNVLLLSVVCLYSCAALLQALPQSVGIPLQLHCLFHERFLPSLKLGHRSPFYKSTTKTMSLTESHDSQPFSNQLQKPWFLLMKNTRLEYIWATSRRNQTFGP